MPRGIPKSGVRLPGAGKKKVFAGELVQKWVPLAVAGNLNNVYQLLVDLEKEVSNWEKICEEKSTSPRYEQARKLTKTLRTMLDGLGINPSDIYANDQQNAQRDDS
ncbi:MAG: hypothetical protein RM022_000095 [Nostoc sp. EfeVER01]|uniref:hypothetical protein n=1 Tax=Nostoc sp. EfeVER01 TaxID=3075406 RepID=UPI002AD22BDB|nr:hypothetical protein [Nostoc sp. EfeVER01]MDZ7944332.1 hypothetical protein [Nostoc sp. EfeVER01]